jgi:hypothetical protein
VKTTSSNKTALPILKKEYPSFPKTMSFETSSAQKLLPLIPIGVLQPTKVIVVAAEELVGLNLL